jgi:hypothetical protein
LPLADNKAHRDGPSKLNAAVRVPATPATVATTAKAPPSPAGDRHSTDVELAHAVVPHVVIPTRAEAVASDGPKSMPETVTLHPAVLAPFSPCAKLTTGAAGAGKGQAYLTHRTFPEPAVPTSHGSQKANQAASVSRFAPS